MWTKWTVLAIIAVLILTPIVLLYGLSFLARRPTNLGVENGKLAPCPSSPNCVSTQADDAEHQIEPIRFTGNPDGVMPKLKRAIATLPRAVIITEKKMPVYLHVECTSLIFRFVDDVEFWIDVENKTIHFRSASRVGHGDLGANRQRMEAIRLAFEKEN